MYIPSKRQSSVLDTTCQQNVSGSWHIKAAAADGAKAEYLVIQQGPMERVDGRGVDFGVYVPVITYITDGLLQQCAAKTGTSANRTYFEKPFECGVNSTNFEPLAAAERIGNSSSTTQVGRWGNATTDSIPFATCLSTSFASTVSQQVGNSTLHSAAALSQSLGSKKAVVLSAVALLAAHIVFAG